ncbi:MAG: creatininase family protein [Burkholderiales bacterium]|nr:creatininase family protein [Opitutaceae bacterium]
MPSPAPVRWAELRPDDFRARLDACPLVYLPIGLVEPHGHVAALGLDLLKADYYCDEAARRFGGIVAPSQGYHIHECGFHAPWLAEVVGNENPYLAALPPHVMVTLFLYQLRAFANTGFRAIVAVSGHSGGSQNDLRLAAAAFSAATGVTVIVKTDSEWVEGLYTGDHAGRYELSQLLAIRPDLVDLSLLNRRHEPDSGGQLALGDDAAEATAEHGRAINDAILASIGRTVATLRDTFAATSASPSSAPTSALLTYADIERIRATLPPGPAGWHSSSSAPNQPPVARGSRWHSYANLD